MQAQNGCSGWLRWFALGRAALLGVAWLILPGCVHQIELTKPQNESNPVSGPVYPDHLTTGDVLEVRYFFEASVEPHRYRLGVGDLIRISVSDHPDLGVKETSILPDGSISLASIGSVMAVGLDIRELEKNLEQQYLMSGIRDPNVSVNVLEGQQRLRGLLEARGSGDAGNVINIQVFEGTPIEMPFIGSVPTDMPLDELRAIVSDRYRREFGGQLNVVVNLRQREMPGVSVMGEVRRPGRIEMSRKLTLLGAVAAAGGFVDSSDTSKVAVVRFDDRQGYSQWLFDLKTALADDGSKHHQFYLRHDDIVVVVKTGIADANTWVAQYIRNMLPIDFGTTVHTGLSP